MAALESRGLNLPEGFVAELLEAVGGDKERVVVDEEECMLHAKPWNSYHPVINVPQAVVYPLYVCTPPQHHTLRITLLVE